jgi:hypothetical protein
MFHRLATPDSGVIKTLLVSVISHVFERLTLLQTTLKKDSEVPATAAQDGWW